VWQATVNGLRLLDPKGRAQTLCLVQDCLFRDMDEEGRLRRAAVDSLTKMAGKGDSSSIAALRDLILREPTVWGDAILALSLLDSDENSKTISSAQAYLRHPDCRLRQAAVSALAKIATCGDEVVVTELRSLLKRELDANVWQTAVQGLSSLDPDGASQIFSSVLACLKHDDWRFRRAALDTLAKTVSGVYDDIVKDIVACFNDIDPTVKWTAVHACGKVANVGDKSALAALRGLVTECSLSAPCPLRCAVVETLIKLTPAEDREDLSDWMTDRDTDVRRVCCEAFAKFALAGDAHANVAVHLLGSRLNRRSSLTSQCQAALIEVARQGHKEAFKVLACQRPKLIAKVAAPLNWL